MFNSQYVVNKAGGESKHPPALVTFTYKSSYRIVAIFNDQKICVTFKNLIYFRNYDKSNYLYQQHCKDKCQVSKSGYKKQRNSLLHLLHQRSIVNLHLSTSLFKLNKLWF